MNSINMTEQKLTLNFLCTADSSQTYESRSICAQLENRPASDPHGDSDKEIADQVIENWVEEGIDAREAT